MGKNARILSLFAKFSFIPFYIYIVKYCLTTYTKIWIDKRLHGDYVYKNFVAFLYKTEKANFVMTNTCKKVLWEYFWNVKARLPIKSIHDK